MLKQKRVINSRGTPNSMLKYSNSGSINDLRGSKSFEKTGDIEAEYIKSLQDQVKLCELENIYLRQKISKLNENQPRMTNEAENMLENLKKQQRKVESLELELYRKESHIDLLNSKITKLTTELNKANERLGKDKTVNMESTVNFRKEMDDMDRMLNQKNSLIEELKFDLERNKTTLEAYDNKIQMLRAQLQDEMEKSRRAELELAAKKSELLQTDQKIKQLESKYVTTNNNFQQSVKRELNEEIYALKEKLKNAVQASDKEYEMRNKISMDAQELMREINSLQKENMDLQNQVEKERSLREKIDHHRHIDDAEFERIRRKEQELEMKIRNLQDDIEKERQRNYLLMKENEKQTQVYNSRSVDDGMSRKRMSEMSAERAELLERNRKLEEDKRNLFERINDLEDETKELQRTLLLNKDVVEDLEARILKLSQFRSMDEDLQNMKVRELEETIRDLKYKMQPEPLRKSVSIKSHPMMLS